jgi:hypothetical protein
MNNSRWNLMWRNKLGVLPVSKRTILELLGIILKEHQILSFDMFILRLFNQEKERDIKPLVQNTRYLMDFNPQNPNANGICWFGLARMGRGSPFHKFLFCFVLFNLYYILLLVNFGGICTIYWWLVVIAWWTACFLFPFIIVRGEGPSRNSIWGVCLLFHGTVISLYFPMVVERKSLIPWLS